MNAPATWLDERRAQAANRFAALGVPHRRIEDWKYSDLKAAIDGANDDAAAEWSLGTLPRSQRRKAMDGPRCRWPSK